MTIADWIKSPDKPYRTGLFLLKESGASTSLMSLLEKGENSFTKKKLLTELEKLLQSPGVLKPEKAPVVIPNKVSHIPSQKLRDALPAEVRAIDELRESSFKEMAHLHASMLEMKTVQARYEAAKKIMDLDAINQECWFKLDYYAKHKRLPESDQEPQIKTIGDVVNASKNIPTYLSKINKKLEQASSEEETSKLVSKKVALTLQLQKISTLLTQEI